MKDGYTILKLPFANQQLVDEELLEDEQGEAFEAVDVERKNIPYEADGQTKVIDRHPHMQTSCGQWTKVDAYGSSYVNTSHKKHLNNSAPPHLAATSANYLVSRNYANIF